MEILSYLQARKELSPELSEGQAELILTISGRAKEWIGTIAKLVQENKAESELEIVERSEMGREVLRSVPHEEWVYLVNPSLAPDNSWVVTNQIVGYKKLFSPVLARWIAAQEIGYVHRLSEQEFTPEEAKIMRALWEKQETILDRESIAQTLWGDDWSNKYSDWALDALVSRLRKKMSGRWQVITIKGRGYMLALAERPTQALKHILGQDKLLSMIPASIYPTEEYLAYMNDQRRVRKIYRDLFQTMKSDNIPTTKLVNGTIICVNSYSYDNVDAIVSWVKEQGWKEIKVNFIHYDPRAIEMHQTRIRELGVEGWISCWHDDLRESKLKSGSVDLVINDFRINFNQDDRQNRAMLGHTYRILKPGGTALLSTVVDGRYENPRYGSDQEKAPINAGKPGLFQADEHLIRRCWTVPYYRQLWEKTGFKQVREFDIEEGKRWGGKEVTLTVDPWRGPYYRRWRMEK